MDKQTQYLGFNGEHPPREQFVMFLDGELSSKENQKWQQHLAACWECRTQVAKAEETIADIMEFENFVMKDVTSRSLSKTDDFYPKLRTLVRESDISAINAGAISRWLGSLGSWLSSLVLFNRTGRIVTVSFVCVRVVAIGFNLLPDRVSAGELYKRSKDAYQSRVLRVTQPVVYRKVTVSSVGESAVLEVWNDVEQKRTKRKVAEDARTKAIIDDLTRIFDENGLNIYAPLSPEDFQVWSEGLSSKTESITKTALPNGDPAYRIDVADHEAAKAGRISRPSMMVAESDWQSFGRHPKVHTGDGERAIDIAEVRFLIIRGVSVSEEFFRG